MADPRQLALIEETLAQCEELLRKTAASPASRELRVRHGTLQRVVRGWVHIPPHDAQIAAMLECLRDLHALVARLCPPTLGARAAGAASRPPTHVASVRAAIHARTTRPPPRRDNASRTTRPPGPLRRSDAPPSSRRG